MLFRLRQSLELLSWILVSTFLMSRLGNIWKPVTSFLKIFKLEWRGSMWWMFKASFNLLFHFFSPAQLGPIELLRFHTHITCPSVECTICMLMWNNESWNYSVLQARKFLSNIWSAYTDVLCIFYEDENDSSLIYISCIYTCLFQEYIESLQQVSDTSFFDLFQRKYAHSLTVSFHDLFV